MYILPAEIVITYDVCIGLRSGSTARFMKSYT